MIWKASVKIVEALVVTGLMVIWVGCETGAKNIVLDLGFNDQSSSDTGKLPADGIGIPDTLSELMSDGGLDLVDELKSDLSPDLVADVSVEVDFSTAVCGDDSCDDPEWCDTCPADCGECTVCGNGLCEPGIPVENPQSCPEDCGSCGDGVCALGELVEADFCIKDCGYACGDGVCNPTESAFAPDALDYCPVDCGGCYDGVCGYQDLLNPDLADCKDADCSTVCGNGACAQGEDWDTCPVDCPVCGDGVCGKVGKKHESCPADCSKPCGDGLCEAGEGAQDCAADCGPCGDGVCSIPEAKFGNCAVDCPDTCGNKHCDPVESEVTCPGDCACQPQCAPDWECGEDGNGCGQACAACPEGSVCLEHLCCVPDCKDKQCGEDGCGGNCGACGGAPLAQCVAGQCQCVPDCTGKLCGDDGCLGSCGGCDDDLFCTLDVCIDGMCDSTLLVDYCMLEVLQKTACAEAGALNPLNPCEACQPDEAIEEWTMLLDGTACGPGAKCLAGMCCNGAANCLGKECGTDACGGDCGLCKAGTSCSSGQCVDDLCTPDCAGKECGDDNCGGSCGSCDDGLFCTSDGCMMDLCVNMMQVGFCVVPLGEDGDGDPACAPDGAESPDNPCWFCSIEVDDSSWTAMPDGTSCGSALTCQSGSCK
jgi:hypothetical protein